MDEKLQQALKDYVATWNSGKYSTFEEMNLKFPELHQFDDQVLKDYINTANSGKYDSFEAVIEKFPEFTVTEEVVLPPKQTEVSNQGSSGTSQTLEPQPSSSLEPLSVETSVGSGVNGSEVSIGLADTNVESNRQIESIDTSELEGLVSVTPVMEESNFLRSVDASSRNFVNQLKGFDDRLSIFSATAYKTLLGENLARKFYAWSDRDIDADLIASYTELQNLEGQGADVATFLEAQNVSDIASATVDSVFATLGTLITSLPTYGAGLITESIGGSIYDANIAKANNLGITVEELYSQGKEDLLAPAVLGAIAWRLEKIGLKGVTRIISRELKGQAWKKFVTVAIDLNKEGLTEALQTGVEDVNKYIAEGGDVSNSAEVFVKGVFSKQGLEAYLKGVVGAGGLGALGQGTRAIINREGRSRSGEIDTEKRELINDLINTQDPILKDAILEKIENLSVEQQSLIDEDKSTVKNTLNEYQLNQASQITENIADIEDRMNDTAENEVKISDQTKVALNERKEQLETTLQELVKPQPKIAQLSKENTPYRVDATINGLDIINGDRTLPQIDSVGGMNGNIRAFDSEYEIKDFRGYQEMPNSAGYYTTNIKGKEYVVAVLPAKDNANRLGAVEVVIEKPTDISQRDLDQILAINMQVGQKATPELANQFADEVFKALNYSPEQNLATSTVTSNNSNLTTQENTIQEPTTTTQVDVRQQARDGQTLGEGNVQEEVVTQEIQTEQIPQEVSNSVSTDSSFLEDLSNQERRTSRINTLQERIDAYKESRNNLGVFQDPEQEARYWRDVTEYAILQIVDGTIKTARQLGQALGISDSEQATRIFDEATRLSEGITNRIERPTETVKQSIRRSTQGGTQGTVTMTTRQALNNQIKTLNRGARDGINYKRDLEQTVSSYIDSRKKGLKLTASTVAKITTAISNIRNEQGLERTLDIVERAIDNAAFRRKLENVDTLKRGAKRAVSGKKVPRNYQSTVSKFTAINPLDLSVDKLDEYMTMLDSINRVGFNENQVSFEQMNQLVALAEANAEVRRTERQLNANTEEATATRNQNRERTLKARLTDYGLTQGEIEDLADSSLPIAERLQALEAKNLELKEDKETRLRNNAENLLGQVIDNLDSLKDQMTPSDFNILNDYINVADINNTPKSLLKGLNFVLDSVVNNADITGIGDMIRANTWEAQRSNETLVTKVFNNLMLPNRALQKLNNLVSGGEIIRQSIARSKQNIGDIDNLMGYTEYSLNSTKAVREWKTRVNDVETQIIKKYEKDFSNAVNLMKADIYAVAVQFESTMTPAEIESEYTERLKAIVKGYEDMVRSFTTNKGAEREFGEYAQNYKRAIDEVVSSYTLADNREVTELTPKLNPTELWQSLPEGLKVYYKTQREFYDQTKERFFSVERAYNNREINGTIENYMPMSYRNYSNEPTESRAIIGRVEAGQRPNDATITKSARTSQSTAGEERLLTGRQIPRGRVINLGGILRGFGSDAGMMLYDIYTLKDRKQLAINTDWRNNGLEPTAREQETDLAPLDIYVDVVAMKEIGDINRFRYGNIVDDGTLNIVYRTMSTLGTTLALNSVAQPVKQITPLADIAARLKNPTSMFEAIRLISTGELSSILDQANVSLRDAGRDYYSFGRKAVSVDRDSNEKALRQLSKKLAIKYEDLINATGGKLLNYFISRPDLMYARIGWAALYIDNLKARGVEFNSETLNREAYSFANNQNDIVMNASDNAMQSKLQRNRTIKMMFPFLAFAINARASLVNSVARVASNKLTRAEKTQAVREIVGNLSSIAMFNVIGLAQRSLSIATGAALVSGFIEAFTIGDERDEETLEELMKEWEEITSQRQELNRINSGKYLMSDIVWGGLFSEKLEPLTAQYIYAPLLSTFYTQQELDKLGYRTSPFRAQGETVPETIANIVTEYAGTAGVTIDRALSVIKMTDKAIQSQEDWIKSYKGFVNAEGTEVMIEEYYKTPEYIEQYGKPDWLKYSQTTNAALQAIGFLGLSDQLVTSSNNYAQTIANKIIEGRMGKSKKEATLEAMKDEKLDFSEIDFGGMKVGVDPVDQVQMMSEYLTLVEERKKARPSKNRSRTNEEYEDEISNWARTRTELKYFRSHKADFKKAGRREVDLIKEENRLLKRIRRFNREQ